MMKKFIFGKYCLTVLLCVSVFFGSFSVTSFAVSEELFSPADVAETQYKNWSELPDDFKALGEAYFNTFCNSDNPASFFKSAADIPISWYKITKDSTPVLSPVGTLFYFLDKASSDLMVYDDSHHSSSHGHSRGVKPDEDFVVPTDDFNDYIKKTEKQYFPKNANGMMSYRTDERWHTKHDGTGTVYLNMDFYSGRFGFSPVGGGNEIYLIFFYKANTDTYYSQMQLHFVLTKNESNYTLTCEYWNMVDGSRDNSTTVTVFENVQTNIFSLLWDSDNVVTCPIYLSLNDYFNFKAHITSKYFQIDKSNSPAVMFKTDLSTSLTSTLNLQSHFQNSLSVHDSKCSFGSACDFGYVASATPISTLYDIEPEKIPSDYYITVSGDTVYDYSITNPETGQKDTIQNFVTNNYTFTTINEGDNSGDGDTSGGTLNGDVKVDGKVDVDGKVEIGGKVDINVNVSGGDNSNSGGNNTSEDSEFEGSFNDYMQYIPEVSDGFIGYLKSFFSWLPPPVFGILMLGLIVSVWCRWRGR